MKKIIIAAVLAMLLFFIINPWFTFVLKPSSITFTSRMAGVNATFVMTEHDENELYKLLKWRFFYRKQFCYTKNKYGWKYSHAEYFTVTSILGFKYKIYVADLFGATVLKTGPFGSYKRISNQEKQQAIQDIIEHYVWYDCETHRYMFDESVRAR